MFIQNYKMPKNNNGTDKLVKAGWKHDGLWWYSPYTKFRYAKAEALAVEELRRWATCGSAILEDKEHSMWVLKEEQDNALITMEDLSKLSQERKLLRGRASDSNLKSKGTD